MYTLNCIVLGDSHRHVFEIKIAPTESVSALQKAIKDAKKQHFGHVDADCLELWQVDLPVDETIEHNLSSLTLDTKKSLSPVTKLQKVFSKIPEDEHLHIVIQGPPMVSSEPLHLNCVVLCEEPNHVFSVDIAQTQTVGDLKDLIKDKTKPQFNDIAAHRLELWKVNLPINDMLKYNLDNLKLYKMKSLSPIDEMLEVFDNDPQHKHLHIVILRSSADGFHAHWQLSPGLMRVRELRAEWCRNWEKFHNEKESRKSES